MNKRKRVRRICVYLVIAVLACFLMYCYNGAPALTPEMAMHRMESAALVGPSRIIADISVRYGGNDRALIGETDHGYTLFEYAEGEWNDGSLRYHAKGDAVTCFSSNSDWWLNGAAPVLPVFVFPERSGAVRARLTLNAFYSYEGEPCSVTHTAEAQLWDNRYFLLYVDLTDANPGVRSLWVRRLNGLRLVYPGYSGMASIELFDQNGEIIDTIVLEFP